MNARKIPKHTPIICYQISSKYAMNLSNAPKHLVIYFATIATQFHNRTTNHQSKKLKANLSPHRNHPITLSKRQIIIFQIQGEIIKQNELNQENLTKLHENIFIFFPFICKYSVICTSDRTQLESLMWISTNLAR